MVENLNVVSLISPQLAIQEAIDKALDNWKHQSMIGQAAVVDLLLDLRVLASG